jgi:hypothetical protein
VVITMSERGQERGDERNGSFDPEPVFQELKPGLESDVRHEEPIQDDEHHRLAARDAKDIPREPLAKRIRRSKGD